MLRLSRTTESSVADGAREALAQLTASGDAELGIDAIQMGPDRAMRQEESLADFSIRQAPGRESSDLELLRRETVAGIRRPRADGFTSGAELLSGSLSPGRRAEHVEQLHAATQWFARVGAASLTAQPAPKREQRPSQQEWVWRQIVRECRGEEQCSVAIRSEEWSRARQFEAEKRRVALCRDFFEVGNHRAETFSMPASRRGFGDVEYRVPPHEAMEGVVVLIEDRPEKAERIVVARLTKRCRSASEVCGCQQRSALDGQYPAFGRGEHAVEVGRVSEQCPGVCSHQLAGDPVLRLARVAR